MPTATIEPPAKMVSASAVLLVPGTHSGSNGPIRYRSKILKEAPGRWDFIPVTLNHPTKNGRMVSVRKRPDLIIGYVDNVRYRRSKLRGTVHLDPNSAPKQLLQRVRDREQVELSTGLFTEVDSSGTLRSYEPDHLAILPTSIGACSVRKGCGVNNSASGQECTCGCEFTFANHLSPNRKRRAKKMFTDYLTNQYVEPPLGVPDSDYGNGDTENLLDNRLSNGETRAWSAPYDLDLEGSYEEPPLGSPELF